ncbi:MAG: hypothetical protein A2660_00130 [Candidatus Doudnabacteria bacterium RIFCSPHIGHO2_01_FULL_45_18]|uniref:DUF378 domain-containing protein n=1 Tax=Candidatus Doudnabacteria bacterium RIFCSPHIGHO2_01_FULL_45_18 TaxID=1817823 RepID=A0A1F5NS96_9BACT|nr:MAG: hypothetical protein A2660_00130 [Candidatus Doudnabacteria bacterium RIFCSPHIGHO2_01_FULL_45_18]
MNKASLNKLAHYLLIVGGLNWGLAIWGYDIATWGLGMVVIKIIYALVGLAALYVLLGMGNRQ